MIKDKPRKNSLAMKVLRDSYEYGGGPNDSKSPSVRRALTIYRKRLEKQNSQASSGTGGNDSSLSEI